MSRVTLTLFVALGAALLAVPALSASLTLHVNTGLWEITSASVMSGLPPIPPDVLSHIPPERRAQAMASMKAAMGNASQTHTMQNCVTQKDLDRPFQPMVNQPESKCSETVVSSSSTMEDIRISCSGRTAMDGHFQFQAPSPGTMKGEMTMTVGGGAQVTHIKSTISGRWLGSSCGSTRPKSG
jgi:hypothetical protein